MFTQSKPVRRASPTVAALVLIVAAMILALLIGLGFRLVSSWFGTDEDATKQPGFELSAEGFDEALAHLTLPDGWVGATNNSTYAFDVRSPNNILNATLTTTRGVYHEVFHEYLKAHPGAGETKWEILGSGLPIVHTTIDNCNFAAIETEFEVTVTVYSCVDEEADLEDYRPAIGQLLEGVSA